MKRRKFISYFALPSAAIPLYLLYSSPFWNALYGKIKGSLVSQPNKPQDNSVNDTVFSAEGKTISVETVLNSRCSSDSDDLQDVFHWGMFNLNERLTPAQTQQIISYAHIPKFTDKRTEIRYADDSLQCIIDNTIQGSERELVMIESGMQQQAVSMVSAALGIGSVIKNRGLDGADSSPHDCITAAIQINPMKPSYDGSYWTTKVPAGKNGWKKGNLSDPQRSGSTPFLSICTQLKTFEDTGLQASFNDISQLLWAVKGRTPHFYKAKPWGLTIPFWENPQEVTQPHILYKNTLFKYNNWHWNRPTHSLTKVALIDQQKVKQLFPTEIQSSEFDTYLLFSLHDTYSRGYWEIGYELYNCIVQACACKLKYKASFVQPDVRVKIAQTIQNTNPVIIVAL